MTSEPLTHAGLGFVMQHLWQRGMEELARLGETRRTAFVRCCEYMNEGPAEMLVEQGTPVVALGRALEHGEWFTWFAATEDFCKYPKAITRLVRQHVKAHDGELHIYSVCVHPETAKWFRLLGFEPDAWQAETAAGFPLYRFKRK